MSTGKRNSRKVIAVAFQLARKESDMSVATLSRKSLVSMKAINRIENFCAHQVLLEDLASLADYLKMSPDEARRMQMLHVEAKKEAQSPRRLPRRNHLARRLSSAQIAFRR